MTDLMEEEEITDDSVAYEMPREIIVDDTTEYRRDYVEVGVDAGDNCADLYAEDAEGAVALRLATQDLDALIDALQQARETVALNS